MSSRRKATSAAAPPQRPSAGATDAAPVAPADGQKDPRRRRRRGDGSLEERIGYRFTDAALLDSTGRTVRLAALTQDKITLLTFFYTYCVDPLGCPFAHVSC